MTHIRRPSSRMALWLLLKVALLSLTTPASAEMLLNQVIVDLPPDAPGHQDIEIWNSGSERLYVVAEPSEIVSPGKADEQRVQIADPQKLGLLVTPNRLILEAGERKLIRMAAIAERTGSEHIYRVAVKPVMGDVTAARSGLKLLIGYDVLVIVRPIAPRSDIASTRELNILTLRNNGNTNAELFDGRQCDAAGKNCVGLPPKRLYAGASWDQPLPRDGAVTYTVKTGGATATHRF